MSSVLGTVGNALTAASVVGSLGDIGVATMLGEAAAIQVAAGRLHCFRLGVI